MIRIPTVNCCEDCCFLESIEMKRHEKVYRCNKSRMYAEVLSDLYETCQLPDIKAIARLVSYMIDNKGDKND
jgi:hypothetical protein